MSRKHIPDPYGHRARQIEQFFEKRGRMPSFSEMATMFGFKSPNAVTKTVAVLVERGLVSKDETGRLIAMARRLDTVMPSANLVPHVGRITAGVLREAVQDCEDYIDAGSVLKTRKGDFFLTVDGDSMIGANIQDGDFVLIRPDLDISNKAIVAAQVVYEDGRYEATLKRILFSRNRKSVTLQPENPDFDPVIVPAERIEIAGVYKGLIRPSLTS